MDAHKDSPRLGFRDSSNNISDSPISPKDIRAQLITSNFIAGSPLKARPPFGVEQNFVGEPIRDRLLRNRVAAEKFAQLLRERGLASAYFDSAPKCGDVCFLHERQATRIFVDVNKETDSTNNKGLCNVVDMQSLKAKPAKPMHTAKAKVAKKSRALEVGPDGLTMPDRLRMAMLEHSPPYPPERGGQSALARVCQDLYANGRETAPSTIKQAHIWELLNGQDSSRYLSIVASVLGVSCLWLQFGIGSKYQQ